MEFEGLDDIVDDVLEDVELEETDTKQSGNESNAIKTGLSLTNFCTFWRSKAMMSINYNREKMLLRFMLGAGKAPSQNSYKKDSKVAFMITREELFKFVNSITNMSRSMMKGQQVKPVQLIHTLNDEKKSLEIAPMNDNKGFFVGLRHRNNSYIIPMNFSDFKFFVFALKMILYEMYTGTRTGFTYNWI